ncbi:DNA-binding response regulator, partial [Pseudomonas aeruginosa]|nr:DNA-binding response regulator [Pseudomonas aeruginosa]
MTQLQNSILLIDDEPQIRKFLRISLNAQGYRVLE